jgi:DNA polymerase-3 subunit delta
MARGRPSAAPSGRSVLRQVLERIDQGWPPGLTVLSGDDLYHLDAAQRALLRRLVPEEATEFALTVYGESKIDVGTAVTAARSAGMFAPMRVVLVRDVGCLEGDPSLLAEFAKRPPSNGYLLVRAPQLDRRRKLHQTLAKSGTLLTFGASTKGMPTEVSAIAKEKRLSIDRAAAEFLAEVCGGDLYRVERELEKVRVWVGGSGPAKVGLETIRETVSGSGLLSGWEVANALTMRDGPSAAGSLRRLIAAGDEPLKILGGLAYRARGMLRAKALIEAGTPPEAALRAAGLWGQPTTETTEGLARYTLTELLAFPSKLLRADRELKSRGIGGGATLESALARLVGERTSDRREKR